MKLTVYRCLSIFLATAFLVACNLPSAGPSTPDANAVASIVAATLQALSTPTGPQAPLTSPMAASPTTELPTASLTPLPSLTATLEATSTGVPVPGTIEGNISGYPYGSIPQLTIVAYEQESPYNYSYWRPGMGATYYSMTSDYLIPGSYQVVAYDPSGHAGGCTTIVKVKSNESVTCDITDWSGSYRSKPAGVP
jgi:hypothetical protein